MEWIENLKEPVSKLDLIYGIIGYSIFKIIEIIIIIFRNINN